MQVCMAARPMKAFINTTKQQPITSTTLIKIEIKNGNSNSNRANSNHQGISSATHRAEIAFTDEEDIFKLGLVNSLFALELVLFLENTFQVAVENEDLKLEHFSTVNNLSDFISRKKGL